MLMKTFVCSVKRHDKFRVILNEPVFEGDIRESKKMKQIPKGIYCYDEYGVCPYWSINKNKPYQENGYCSFLERGDWTDEAYGLLWDQVKECGINNELSEGGLNENL